MPFNINIIGHVENNLTERGRIEAGDIISRIIIDPAYAQALDGIDDFSHIIVVFWLDRIKPDERNILKVHPRGSPDNPLTGVFATHSPVRPNPIAITTVELLDREGNILTVKGLDALNNTPILDIKCYLPSSEPSTPVNVPGWVNRKS